MQYTFQPLKINEVKTMSSWQYEGKVENLYMKPYFESFENGDKILKGPNNCEGFSVYRGDQLFGLFEYYNNSSTMEIGLALNPKFTGKGLAYDFLISGLKFGIKYYNYQNDYIKLYVNKENKPAFSLYKKAGFKITEEYEKDYEMKIKTKQFSKRRITNE